MCGLLERVKKQCNRCKNFLYYCDFNFENKEKTKYQPACRKCTKLYYNQNRAKIVETSRIFREKNPDYSKSYYRENKERINKRTAKYNKTNEKNILYIEKYHKSQIFRDSQKKYSSSTKGRAKKKIHQKKYNSSEKGRVSNKVRCANRNVARKKRTPKWLTEQHKKQIFDIYKTCFLLNKKGSLSFEVDHIVPLQGRTVSGLHVPWNLRIIERLDNCKKGNKLIQELATDKSAHLIDGTH